MRSRALDCLQIARALHSNRFQLAAEGGVRWGGSRFRDVNKSKLRICRVWKRERPVKPFPGFPLELLELVNDRLKKRIKQSHMGPQH